MDPLKNGTIDNYVSRECSALLCYVSYNEKLNVKLLTYHTDPVGVDADWFHCLASSSIQK
jgi:hypothetical protein